jgi:phosphoglycerate dehydrogenase-like enzyme
MPARLVVWALIEPGLLLREAQRQLGEAAVLAGSVAEVSAALREGAEMLVLSDAVYSAAAAAALRDCGSRLRWIQCVTTGTDRMRRFGVPPQVVVSNVGDAFAPAVATHAVALLLALQRRLPATLAAQAEHRWEREVAMGALIPLGQRAVVFGFGPIGQEIGRLLGAFGMQVTAVSRSGAASALAPTLPAARFDEALAEADALILAAPLTPETEHIVDADRLARCRPGMLLVNIGRGGLVDQVALAAALRDGRLGGAALDVADPEPLPPGDPLWRAPNLIVTPHVAGLAAGVSMRRICDVLGNNLRRVLAGEAPGQVVMGAAPR